MNTEPTPESVFSIVNRYIPNEQNFNIREIEAALNDINELGVSRFELVAQCLNLQPSGKVKVLLEHGGQSAKPFIQYSLESNYSRSRSQSLQIAYRRGDLKLLQEVFSTHYEESMRDRAAELLILTGEDGTSIVEEGLENKDDKTRSAATKAMTKFLRENQDISVQFRERNIAKFTVLLDDNISQIRRSAFSVLRTFHRLTNQIITRFTKDEDSGIRFDAYNALLTRHVDEFTAQLFALAVEDPDGDISNYFINEINPKDYPIRYIKAPRALADAIIETSIVRDNELPDSQFNPDRTYQALSKTIELNPQLYGEILNRLKDLALENEGDIRHRAVFVASRINEREFIALVTREKEENPDTVVEILNILRGDTNTKALVRQLSKTDPEDVIGIASNQINLLTNFYDDALTQAKESQKWARGLTVVGLIVLIATIVMTFIESSSNVVAIATGIGGVLAEFIALTQFRLLDKTVEQRALFHKLLSKTQRILLANSICETLSPESSNEMKVYLIKAILDQKNDEISIDDALSEGS